MPAVTIPSDANAGRPGILKAPQSATVGKTSSAYKRMSDHWTLTQALLGGTQKMREDAHVWLPKHTGETPRNWRMRVAASFLLGYYRRALRNLSSRPFSRPVALEVDLPEQLGDLAKNCDLQGNDLTDFSKPAFRDGLRAGLTYIFVDMPPADQDATTLAEERPKRPYLVHYPAESVIAMYAETDAEGRQRLTHVRLREFDTVLDESDYTEFVVERIRVLKPGKWEVWEKRLGGSMPQADFTLTAAGDFPSMPDEIPLVVWYAGEKKGLGEAELPLGDMAEKNLEHFRSASDQRNCLTVARFPMLAATGVAPKREGPKKETPSASDDEEVVVGPRKMLTASKPEARFSYVETTGAALEAGRKDLEALEDHMAVLGAELLARHAKYTTATEKDINAAEVMSDLQSMCVTFEDALTKALRLAARMAGITDKAAVEAVKAKVWRQFAGVQASSQDLDALLKARMSGSMARKLFLDELQRRGVLADDVDTEAEALAAEQEEEAKHEEKKELALIGKQSGPGDINEQQKQGTKDGAKGDTAPPKGE